ncbi:helix-turn-helix transcriptional regulator [bacterium]|nr:helix-turn-helix transcriptional regulator [bacterium]
MNEKDILLKIGRNICAERNRAGYSQEGLAEQIGMNEKHIGRIERGLTNPKITTIIAIMDALNLPFDALYKK